MYLYLSSKNIVFGNHVAS